MTETDKHDGRCLLSDKIQDNAIENHFQYHLHTSHRHNAGKTLGLIKDNSLFKTISYAETAGGAIIQQAEVGAIPAVQNEAARIQETTLIFI